jgi:hypothetical protein
MALIVRLLPSGLCVELHLDYNISEDCTAIFSRVDVSVQENRVSQHRKLERKKILSGS